VKSSSWNQTIWHVTSAKTELITVLLKNMFKFLVFYYSVGAVKNIVFVTEIEVLC